MRFRMLPALLLVPLLALTLRAADPPPAGKGTEAKPDAEGFVRQRHRTARYENIGQDRANYQMGVVPH